MPERPPEDAEALKFLQNRYVGMLLCILEFAALAPLSMPRFSFGTAVVCELLRQDTDFERKKTEEQAMGYSQFEPRILGSRCEICIPPYFSPDAARVSEVVKLPVQSR